MVNTEYLRFPIMNSLGKKEYSGLELLSFNIDIELCGWLFSLYQCGYPNYILSHRDSDLIKVSQGFGVIYELSSNEPPSLSPVSGKVTSIFFVIGLGSLLCYRFLKFINRFHIFSFSKSSSDSTSASPPLSSSIASQHFLSFKTSYFGPKNGDPFVHKDGSSREKNDLSSTESIWPTCSSNNFCVEDTRKLPKGWLLSNLQHYILSECEVKEEHITDNAQIISSTTQSVRRDGSVDSMSSELSFDLSGIVENDSSTFARMDQLQREIDLLKSNCLSMDEEFESIKTNRNLPGLSSLLESHQISDFQLKESARACFKGLYSLTTINRSLSSDFSGGTSTDDDNSPIHVGIAAIPAQTEEGSFSSLEWDTQDANTFIPTPTDRLDTTGYGSLHSSVITNDSLLPMEHSWSSDSFDQLFDLETMDEHKNTYRCYSDSSSPARNAGYVMGDGVSNINNISQEIIGPLLSFSDYIRVEWINDKLIPENTRKGYETISEHLGFHHIRQIYSDNYSGIRASLYQVLCNGFPITSGQATLNLLTATLLKNGQWLSSWSFSNKLPYTQQNCIRGIQICLATLDNVVQMLQGAENKGETLTALMNNDPTLDAHLVEAIKLQMVAFSLQSTNTETYYDFSQFNVQDNDCTEVDFMNNYLYPMGVTSGLQEVELLNLLGCTLGVVLQIIKPSAYGTHEFKTFHPDSNINNWPVIDLISENERNYYILLE